jgi:hypothetical protein
VVAHGRPARAEGQGGDRVIERAVWDLRPPVMATLLAAAALASAVPPPPARADIVASIEVNGPELVVRDTVRAYQSVPVAFDAQAGDRLLVRLNDGEQVLVLGMEAPSRAVWMSGARPGPDGLELRLAESGRQRARRELRARPATAPLTTGLPFE